MKTGLQTVNMPMVGLGSWQSAPGEVEKSIEWALEAGVRMIDTAYMVRNDFTFIQATRKLTISLLSVSK